MRIFRSVSYFTFMFMKNVKKYFYFIKLKYYNAYFVIFFNNLLNNSN